MLTDGFKETHERVVLLPEVDVETFQVFEGWLSNLKLSEFKDLDWWTQRGSYGLHILYIALFIVTIARHW